MSDNYTTNAGSGGANFRAIQDSNGVLWAAGLTGYGLSTSGGAPATPVDLTHGLPVQPQTGITFPISAASLPLPSGAATAANQPTLVGGLLPVLLSGQTGNLSVVGSGNFATLASQSGTWTVGISAAQTIAVTNAGTFATQISSALPSGTNIIGKLTTDQTTHGTTDLVAADITKVAGSAISQGHGTAATAIRVELPTDGTGIVGLGAGTNLIGKVGFDQTTPGATNGVAVVPVASGGLSVSRTFSANNTTGISAKISAGQVYGWYISNVNTSPRFVKLYNKSSAPTIGTDVPTMTLLIPGTANGGGTAPHYGEGIPFSSGIGYGITTGVADNDTGAPAANEVVVNLLYK